MDYTKFDSVANISKNKTVHAGIYVKSLEMPDVEMLLSGFVGYNDCDDILLTLMPDLNAPIYVTPHRIKAGETIFPVMKTVGIANDSETVEVNYKNKIGIIESDNRGVETFKKFVNGYLNAAKATFKFNEISQNKFKKDCFESKENTINYHTLESDYILRCDDRKYVSANFLCLCRYTNPIMGNMTYNLFEPDNIIVSSEFIQE